MATESEAPQPESPGEASRRGLESLHDGERHPTEGDVLPQHDEDAAAASPARKHRAGPLANEK